MLHSIMKRGWVSLFRQLFCHIGEVVLSLLCPIAGWLGTAQQIFWTISGTESRVLLTSPPFSQILETGLSSNASCNNHYCFQLLLLTFCFLIACLCPFYYSNTRSFGQGPYLLNVLGSIMH